MSFIPAYIYNDKIYLNITNRCPNNCSFCIRKIESAVNSDLWLDKEPSVEDILDSVSKLDIIDEITFCGYGEPLLRPEIVAEVSKKLKEKYGVKIRVNTNGLADLSLDRKTLPFLNGVVDTISISLNAHNDKTYMTLCQPATGPDSFNHLLSFAKEAVKYIPKVLLSVVNLPEVDIDKCKDIAQSIGVELRVRNLIQ